MALGNFTSIEFNQDGERPSSESFITPEGVTAYIYKDWMYVRDGGKVVMEIQEGRLRYRDLRVFADRINGAFFVAVCTLDYEKAMYGVGAYAYDGDDYVGIDRHLPAFMEWLKTKNKNLPNYTLAAADKFFAK